jgi:pimeloyl-ACP methyl ester carboxylesterase
MSHKWFGTDVLAKFLLDKVLRDFAFYYDPKRKIKDRAGKMRVAHRVLMDELANAVVAERQNYDGELIVIAHSMGTIIAYDVLRELGREIPGFKVEHFVTIGSPLGLPTVKANVLEENKNRPKADWVRTPTVVTKSWINYADRRDPVCLDNHLASDYGANISGIKVKDDIVLNDYCGERDAHDRPAKTRKDAKPNPHKSYGYLRTPELSQFLSSVVGTGGPRRWQK